MLRKNGAMILDRLPSDELKRYPGIDIFRGIAIFTMLMANSAAESLEGPHNFIVRIYGSFAAPVFVFLAGFMVAIGSRKHNTAYFFRRAIEIIVVAMLIDFFIWKIIPFTTFDVLYLTALGIPVAALVLRMKFSLQIIVAAGLLIMGPVLQSCFTYEAGVHEFFVKDFSISGMPAGVTWWFKSLIMDGWFPVFPWMGILVSGALVAKHGAVIIDKANVFIAIGFVLFFVGITWLYFYRPLEAREGYSELFYPPGGAYLVAAAGVILVGTAFLKYLKPVYGLQVFQWLGSCSLFIYILHSALIAFVLDEYFTALPLKNFLLLYIVFVAVNVLFAFLFFQLKKKTGWKQLPQVVRFIFGG
jgi:uncharacterized membrane protein